MPRQRDVLFLLYPTHGHVRPNLAVIAELARRGDRVRAVVSGRFAPEVAAAGAEPVLFDPPLAELPSLAGLTEAEWAEASKDVFLDVIKATRAVVEHAESDPPAVVAFDSALWAPARVTAARLGVPAVQLVPTSIDREPFTPGSVRIGARDDDAEWDRLVSFGAALVSLFDAHGVPGTSFESFTARPGERTVAFVPRDFQPESHRYGDRYTFVGPCLAPPDGTPSWRPPADDRPVLLLSLGTTSNDRLSLFTDCVAAFAESPWHVVITLGGRFDPGALGPLPPSIEAHGWLRHPEVLAHARASVSQAGMGSVMESLAHAVPVVAVPSHPEAIANARRVGELGLGRWLPATEVSGVAVRAAVDAVAGDADTARRLSAMRAHIDLSGGARAAADVIQRVTEEDCE
ncbi:glycosyltransferase [Actinokineospora auranticolor]|uniref:MGT family glycosyltransferase n=1 Tax=Actinokineospora auranticolor TaxID=155976 RepID=A0A2S6GTB9_9PSEU|nr:macrolide family glycosyltransferase [Actinokineospora auranticolor]PPK68495.1 MGT family glycosyltransferase [Actinokineospora auranticolor]